MRMCVYICVCVNAHMSWSIYRGQRTTWWNGFFPTTMCVPEIDLVYQPWQQKILPSELSS